MPIQRNNQSGCRPGYVGHNKMQYKQQSANGTTIKIHNKIINLEQSTTATINAKQTQQPTGWTERNQFERMQPAGEEGDNKNNTAITRGGDDACFVVMFCMNINL